MSSSISNFAHKPTCIAVPKRGTQVAISPATLLSTLYETETNYHHHHPLPLLLLVVQRHGVGLWVTSCEQTACLLHRALLDVGLTVPHLPLHTHPVTK